MNFPSWTPDGVRAVVRAWEKVTADPTHGAFAIRMVEIWKRLATRPEMEYVWKWVYENKPFPLDSNMGLFFAIDRAIEDYDHLPKLSPAAYKKAMGEIAALAKKLHSCLEQFDSYMPIRNPFELSQLLTEDQKDTIATVFDEQHREGTRRENAFYDLFPSMSALTKQVEEKAEQEAVEQISRLEISRKANDKNAFRTFFIRRIAWHFIYIYVEYSPTRIATICSVALDDPDITPDLVRQLAKPPIPLR